MDLDGDEREELDYIHFLVIFFPSAHNSFGQFAVAKERVLQLFVLSLKNYEDNLFDECMQKVVPLVVEEQIL